MDEKRLESKRAVANPQSGIGHRLGLTLAHTHTHTQTQAQRTVHIDSETDWGKGISARNLSTLISELNLCNKTASSTAIFAVRVPMPGRIWLHLAVPPTSTSPNGSCTLAVFAWTPPISHRTLCSMLGCCEGEVLGGRYPCPYPKTFPGQGWAGVWFMVYAPPFLVY